MAPLNQVRTWSRSCDVAVAVYRLISQWPDRNLAARVLENAFQIPERVAAGLATQNPDTRHRRFSDSAEALAVLQTQIYLACECGLVERDISERISFDARAITEQLAILNGRETP